MLAEKKNHRLWSGIVLIQGASGGSIKMLYLSSTITNKKRGCMTGEILESVLSSFNLKVRSQNRFILLLLDNAGCHPITLQGKYSNIKIVFLPPNTTSKLQPLDLGIICNFKTRYCRLFLQHVIARMDTATCASDVISSINILMAIRWVAFAWRKIKATTITKCFQKAGILNENAGVLEVMTEDPFLDADETLSLGSLLSTAMGCVDSCSVEEYVNGDLLQFFADIGDQWEANFMEALTPEVESQLTIEEENTSDNEDLDILPPSPKIKNFKEAVQALEDVQLFLESRGCMESAHANSLVLNSVASDYTSILKQSTLDRFIS